MNKLQEQEMNDNMPNIESSESTTDKFEHYHFVVDKGQTPLRIDKYLTACMSNISRNRIQDAALAQSILVNGKVIKANYKVKSGDEISIVLDYPKTDFTIVAQDIPIDVVYEDSDLMVVNKHPDMVVHPGFGHQDGTLLNAIAWHLKDDSTFDANDPRIGLVHRIDKDTSGLLLIAKNENAKSILGKQFYNKTTERTYNALVWGHVSQDEGTISAELARDPKDRMCFTVFPDGENPVAKHAVTHYRVLKRFLHVSLVECKLETGRTHQIRVHMKHIGHTLFNDERYGGNEVLRGIRSSKYKQYINNCFATCPRQALHAKTLGFEHPVTHEWMQFNTELPSDMQALIEKWDKYTKTQSNGNE